MKISKVTLRNFRAAKNLDIKLHGQMNLFVGVNGAGKSTVLQAVAYALIALVRKVHNSKNNLGFLRVSDIRRFEDQSSIEIDLSYDNERYLWNIERTRPGGNSLFSEKQEELNKLSKILKNKYKLEESLPVLVYYPVGRVIDKNTMPSARFGNQDEQLDVYNDALEGKPNFQNFFRWFRDQGDFINQKSLSRSHWIKRNNPMLRRRLTQIMNSFDSLREKDNPEFQSFQKERLREMDFLLHEPRFLFREIRGMIYMSGTRYRQTEAFEQILIELDYMLHKMDMLSNEGPDFIVDSTRETLPKILAPVLSLIVTIQSEQRKDKRILNSIWQIFILSFELGLWWLSDEGHSRLVKELTNVSWSAPQKNYLSEIDPKNFSDKIFVTEENIINIIDNDIRRRSTAQNNFGKDIQNVARAIEQFVPEYSNLRINRSERGFAQMLVDKHGQEFDIGQLSDGEKNLIALIGDIARRLTIGNPNSEDPLKESGVVLIDEIDLHLHPKWQRIVAERITEVFPNCQFIISSHSPQVISHIKPESVFVLKNDNGEISSHSVNESYGKNSDRILEDIMDESSRPKDIDDEIKLVFRLIQEGNVKEAQEKIALLRNNIGEDGELVKASVLMKRREIIGK
jgi:predicted ATP-binding protein involved in virulence